MDLGVHKQTQAHSKHLQQIETATLTFSVELKLHSSFVGVHLRCR